MIVVAIFLSLAILPTARAADETVWAPDDPVENYCVAVDALVKVFSADAVKADMPIAVNSALPRYQGEQRMCADPRGIAGWLRYSDTLCESSTSLVRIFTSISENLLLSGVLDRNFRVPAEVVEQIGIGIAFALRAALAVDCDNRATSCVEPR